mgnify:CR=1 FL=1
MRSLVSGSVTYTIQGRGILKEESGFKMANIKIAFGDSALTYPTGGIPLSNLSKWGFPNLVDSLVFQDAANANGFVYKWDRANNKLLIYRSAGVTPAGTVAAPVFTGAGLAAHTHDMLGIGGLATTSNEALFLDASQKFGKNAATNRTIVGSTSATTGGVVAVTAGTEAGTNSAPAFTGSAIAAAALIEATTGLAPAATVLYALVRGY